MENLNHKAWWRFLKVIYVGVYVFFTLFVLFIAYLERPQQVGSNYNNQLICDNGASFTQRNSNNHLELLKPGSQEDIWARRICQYGETEEYKLVDRYPTSENKNFRVELASKIVGSWQDFFKVLGIGLVIIFTAIELIKSAVLYILGISVWKGMLLYLIMFLASFNKDKN